MKNLYILLFLSLFTLQTPYSSFGQDWIWWSGFYDSVAIPMNNSIPTGSSTNTPGSRAYSQLWQTDSNTIFLFGGDVDIPFIPKNDIWKFDKSNFEWQRIINEGPLNYGSNMQFSPSFRPGFFQGSASWLHNNQLYVLGQSSFGTNKGAEIWVYSTTLNQWAITDTNTINGSVNYGLQGVSTSSNLPRWQFYPGYVKYLNKIYIFGGSQMSIGSSDLWEYDLITSHWTWLKGNDPLSTSANYGIYGSKGMPNINNTPCDKLAPLMTSDNQGNLWLFGGDNTFRQGSKNDLWKYNISTNIWTWVGGDSLNKPRVFGPPGVFGSNYYPGPANNANSALSYKEGRLFLFSRGEEWIYDIITDQWATIRNNSQLASFSVGQGIASSNNIHGGYKNEYGYKVLNNSNIILYGGHISPQTGRPNDLWEWDLNCGAISLQESSQNITCENDNNGEMSISSTGGKGTITYALKNGPFQVQTTYQNLSPGDYWFRFQDSLGCIRYSDTVTLVNPSPISSTVSQTSPVRCNNESNGVLSASSSGGWGGFQYSLDSGQSFQSSSSFNGLPAGTYRIIIEDLEGCRDTTPDITLSNPPVLQLSSQRINPITCFFANDGQLSASSTGGVPPYEYGLGGSFQSSNTFANLSPGSYSIQVRDDNNCIVGDTISYTFSDPVNKATNICLVTVDSTSSFNQVVWENPKDSMMGEVRIFREFLGLYNIAGIVDANDESIFIDQTPGIDPNQQSYRYTIEAYDTCGTGASQSPYHETIHVQVSRDVNNNVIIDWDDYEGFPFTQYDIVRSVNGSPYQVLTSVSATVQSQFTDNNPPTGNVQYRVEVVPNAPCESDDNKSVGIFTKTISNVQGSIVALNKAEWFESHFQIYPNPAGEQLHIRSLEELDIQRIRLLDGLGHTLIFEEINYPLTEHSLNLRELPQGWYVLQIETKDEIYSTTIIR